MSATRRPRLEICAAAAGALAVLLSAAAPASAQHAELRASPAPYYAGVAFDIQISVTGFDEDPQPVVSLKEPPGTSLNLAGVSPNISQSIQIVDGRVSRSKTVRFNFNYRFTAEIPGTYRIGPAVVTQGDKSSRTSIAQFTVIDVPSAGDQMIRLLLPKDPVYVGQRVQVKLQWWAEHSLMSKLINPVARVPLFDRGEDFLFIDSENTDSPHGMVVETAAGAVEFPAQREIRRQGGKQYVVTSVERTMIPLKSGVFEIPASTVVVDEALRWRRDLFGQRIPTQLRKIRSTDSPRTLSVKTPPSAGRPTGFTGTVGQAFAIEVKADRSVVTAGDPITLTITIKGKASLEGVQLPSLVAAGLSPEHFRVPAGSIAGIVEGGAKRFEATIRVIDDKVTEIPPLRFYWFDPELQAYQSAASLPIALSVKAARFVGAGDVVTAHDDEADEAAAGSGYRDIQAPSDDRAMARPASGGQTVFTLSGADLSVERNLDTLLGRKRTLLSQPLVQILVYSAGLLAVLMAWVSRRHADMDPRTVARNKELQHLAKTVASSQDTAELAAALRRMGAIAVNVPRRELDALLSQCDEEVYAPGHSATAIDPGLKKKAGELARTMLENSK